jgi:hypothetical protein
VLPHGTATQALSKYFPDADSLPPLLQQLKQQYTQGSTSSTADGDTAEAMAGVDAGGTDGSSDGVDHAKSVSGAALGALGLMVSFLSSNMLDKALLPHAKYEELCDGVSCTPEFAAAVAGLHTNRLCACGEQSSCMAEPTASCAWSTLTKQCCKLTDPAAASWLYNEPSA